MILVPTLVMPPAGLGQVFSPEISSGMYTVMIAEMKRRVVAVDPIRDNLALISSSVSKAGNSPYVHFVASPIR